MPDFEIPDIDFDLPDSPRPTAVGTGAAIPDYLPTPTDFSILEEMKRDGVGVDKTQLEELPDVAIPARRDVTTGLGEASPSPSDKPSNSAKPREASPSPSDTQELPVVKVASSETPSQRPPTSSTSNVEWDKEWVEDIIGGPPIPDAPKYPKSASPGHGSFQLDDELGESKRAKERESEHLSSHQLVTDIQEMQDSIMRNENGTKSLNFELLRQLAIDNNNDDRRLRELVYAFQNSRTTLSDVNI